VSRLRFIAGQLIELIPSLIGLFLDQIIFVSYYGYLHSFVVINNVADMYEVSL